MDHGSDQECTQGGMEREFKSDATLANTWEKATSENDRKGGSVEEMMSSLSTEEEIKSANSAPRKGKKYDAVLVFAYKDEEKADEIMKTMTKIVLRDGSNAKVALYDEPEFGGSKTKRPSIICEMSAFVFILATENIEEDTVAEFTKRETIAHTRIMNLSKHSDAVRPLKEPGSTDTSPLKGLADVAPIPWNVESDATNSDVCHLFQYQRDEEERQADVTAERYDIKERRGICLIVNNTDFKRKTTTSDTKKGRTKKFSEEEKPKWKESEEKRREEERKALNRYSSEWESRELKSIFEKMNYEVKEHHNLGSKDLEKVVEEVSKEDHTEYDSIICYFLSHGNMDVIYGSDVDDVHLHVLFDLFSAEKCPSLKGKPKLFFIETCRSPFKDTYDTERVDKIKCYLAETDSQDFYICYATSPGEVSIKNNEKGDWFTVELIDALKTKSKGSDLTGIMNHVKYQLSKRKIPDKNKVWLTQKPDIINRLTKRFYFENLIGKTSETECRPKIKKDIPTAGRSQSKSQFSEPVPFEEISLDILGPFQVADNGSHYVLLLTDSVTKWVEADSIGDKSRKSIADFFMRIVCTHGTPRIVITNSGNDFSQKISGICEVLGIEHKTTSAKTQSHEIAVNFNRKLRNLISDLVKERPSDWETRLPYLLLVYRTTVHESTHTDPFSKLFGREAQFPRTFDIPCPDEGVSEDVIILRKVEALVNLSNAMNISSGVES